MSLSLLAAAVLLQPPTASDMTRKEIGQTRLSLELSGAVIPADSKPKEGMDHLERYESFISVDLKNDLSVTVIYAKYKDDVPLLPKQMLERWQKEIAEEHSGAHFSVDTERKVTPFSAGLLGANFVEDGVDTRQNVLYIWGGIQSWTVLVKGPSASSAAIDKILNSAALDMADWKRWKFSQAHLIMELPVPSQADKASFSDEFANTLSETHKWVANAGELSYTTITYMKAKEGTAFGPKATLDAIKESIQEVGGELVTDKVETVTIGGATGIKASGTYKMGPNLAGYVVILLTRGKEGWDIRSSGAGTDQAMHAMMRIANSVTIEDSQAAAGGG